jgi:hypothetical protein
MRDKIDNIMRITLFIIVILFALNTIFSLCGCGKNLYPHPPKTRNSNYYKIH